MPDKDKISEQIEDYTHYHRTCYQCGANWWGLHCPHDGYQNPCPSCGIKPPTLPTECDCEFVVPVTKITQLLLEESNQRIKRIYENSMYGEDKTAKDVQERLEAALKETK